MSLRISAGLSHRLKPALRAAMAVEKLRRVFWCSSPLQWGYVSGTVGLYRRADGAVYAIFAHIAVPPGQQGRNSRSCRDIMGGQRMPPPGVFHRLSGAKRRWSVSGTCGKLPAGSQTSGQQPTRTHHRSSTAYPAYSFSICTVYPVVSRRRMPSSLP